MFLIFSSISPGAFRILIALFFFAIKCLSLFGVHRNNSTYTHSALTLATALVPLSPAPPIPLHFNALLIPYRCASTCACCRAPSRLLLNFSLHLPFVTLFQLISVALDCVLLELLRRVRLLSVGRWFSASR